MQSNSSLPDDWKRDSILSIVDPVRPITYGVVQPGERLKQGIPIIRGQDYSRGVVDDSDLYLIHPNIAEAYARSSLKGGDILFSIVGYLGQTAVVPPTLSGANITQTTARIAVKSPNQSRFFLHQFRSELFAPEVRRHQKGSAQPGLNLTDVEKMLVVIPPPHEQSRIAAVLDTVDEAITKTEAVIAKFKQVRAGLLHDLLIRGLDLSACNAQAGEHSQLRDPVAHPEQFPDSPLGRIPKEWAVGRLVENASVLGGKRLPAGHSYAELPTGYRYLRVIDFYERAISFNDLVHLRYDTFATLSRYEISDGELFISIAGSLGYVGVLRVPSEDRIILTENAARIHINSGFVPEFLSLMMNSNGVQQQINAEKGIGSGVPKLALFRIESLWVGRPKEHEQKAIVRLLAEFDDGIRSEQRELAKLQSLKSGLATDLLIGRVRVPEGIAVTG